MKIEKLEPSRHRQGRWLVWLEDGSLVRLGEGEVVSLSLYSGKELTEEEGEALAAAEIQGRLNERAVALLSARPMSRRELVDKLSAPARRRKKPSREADEVQPDPEDCSMTGSMPAQWPGITQKRATVRGRFRMSCTAGECPGHFGRRRWTAFPRGRTSWTSCSSAGSGGRSQPRRI